MEVILKKEQLNIKNNIIYFVLFTISSIFLDIAVTYGLFFILIFMFFFFLAYYFMLVKREKFSTFIIHYLYYIFLSNYFYFAWVKTYSIYLVFLASFFLFFYFSISLYIDYLIFKKYNLPGGFSLIWIILVFFFDKLPIGSFFFNWIYFFPTSAPFIKYIKSYGITFIILIMNQLIAYYFVVKKKWKTGIIFSLIFALFFLFTYFYSIKFANVKEGKKKVTVALFQGNYPQSWEQRKAMVNIILDNYIDLTKKAYKEKPFDLAVWPEYAIPGDPFENRDIYNKLSILSSDLKIYLVTGCSPWVHNHPRYANLDTAIIFDPQGKLVGRYDSVLPLPYDYDVKPGKKKVIFDLPVGKFGITMCYEEISFDLNKYYVDQGVDFLLILTNHAYFDNTKGLFQSSALSRVRAAENGIYALRATNTGYTQIVSPTGVILKKLKKRKRGYLIEDIYIKENSGTKY